MLRPILVAAALLMAAAAGRAEDARNGVATREYLLDDVPRLPTVLRDQWRPGAPPQPFDSAGQHYGLLGDTSAPRPITLTESIALALENNTGLRIAKLNPISAANAVRGAYAQFDPQLVADVNKQRRNTPVGTISPFTNEQSPDIFNQAINWNVGLRKRVLTGGFLSADWTNARISSDPNAINQLVPAYVTGLNLTLNQPLLRDFGWRFALLVVDVAQIDEEQAFYDYAASVAGLVENVERAYWTYVLAIENLRVEEKGLDLARELLRQNQGRYNVGALPRTTVLESEAEVARREANLVRSGALQRIARDNLRALINAKRPNGDDLLMIEPADKPSVAPAEPDLEDSLRIAYTQRPELVAARLDVDGRRVQTKIAQNALLPRLDLVGSVGLNGLGGSDAMVPSQFGVANPQVLGGYSRSLELLTDGRYYQYLFGARIEIPIANAAAQAQYAQAKINAEAARLSLQELEESVTLDITQSVNNVKALLKAIDATRIARRLAEENVRNQQYRYDVGLATTKDLIDFQDRLTQAERSEIESLSNYNIELARLHFARGTLLEERGVVLERAAPGDAPWWARF
ncbi:MAG: TolC family protein [Candidatus Binatia bacterium]